MIAECDVIERALRLAVNASTSAIDDCMCESCEETRAEMRDWFLTEAREQLAREEQ